MRSLPSRVLAASAVVVLAALACNYPNSTTATPDPGDTLAAQTLSALQTGDVLTQQAAFGSATLVPEANSTLSASTLSPGNNPVVAADTLCWVGPGAQYEVVSAVRSGTVVQLLGQGTISGWYIIRNPIYHDPCWLPASALTLNPGIDVAGLPYFSPPATPTFTPTQTPPPTETPASPPPATNTHGTP